MSESERGCGYRKIGGLYLVSDAGPAWICDGLPLPLLPCDCCDYQPPFSRNLEWITLKYVKDLSAIKHDHKWPCVVKTDWCSCPEGCPICHPELQQLEKFGLMYVGQKFYTPESFLKEAVQMGISKRIPEIPKGLKLGETWIFLAHLKVPFYPKHPDGVYAIDQMLGGLAPGEPITKKAIFYGFKPQRIEMPIWKGTSTEKILKLEKKGITPVLIDETPENLKKHRMATDFSYGVEKRL